MLLLNYIVCKGLKSIPYGVLLFKNYIGGVEMALTLHNGDLNKLARDTSQDSINFMVGGQKIITLESTGDIYVKR